MHILFPLYSWCPWCPWWLKSFFITPWFRSCPNARIVVNRLPQLVLVVAAVVLMVRTERFFTPGTLTSILTQASIVGVLALGQAFVLIGGGFDLSQGAILALTAALTGHLAQRGVSPAVVGGGRPGDRGPAGIDQRRDGLGGADQSVRHHAEHAC